MAPSGTPQLRPCPNRRRRLPPPLPYPTNPTSTHRRRRTRSGAAVGVAQVVLALVLGEVAAGDGEVGGMRAVEERPCSPFLSSPDSPRWTTRSVVQERRTARSAAHERLKSGQIHPSSRPLNQRRCQQRGSEGRRTVRSAALLLRSGTDADSSTSSTAMASISLECGLA